MKVERFDVDWTDEDGEIQERQFPTFSQAERFAKKQSKTGEAWVDRPTVFVMPVVNGQREAEWRFENGKQVEFRTA